MRRFLQHHAFGRTAHRVDGIAVCAIVVCACTAVLLARQRAGAPLAEQLGGPPAAATSRAADPTPPAHAPGLDAYVVFQLRDCDGNLRVLDLLRRRSLRGRVTLAGLAFVGTDDEFRRVRSRLPRESRSVPIRRATRASIDLLGELGHRSTPIVVVLDAERRVRYVTGAPRSPRAYVGLARVLSSLEAADAP